MTALEFSANNTWYECFSAESEFQMQSLFCCGISGPLVRKMKIQQTTKHIENNINNTNLVIH